MFIKKKFYIKSWLLWSNNLFVLKENYMHLGLIEKKGVFIKFEIILYFICKLKTVLTSFKLNKGRVLFVATRSTYLKSFSKRNLWSLVVCRYAGLFSNFSIVSSKAFEGLNFPFAPSCLIFFHNRLKDQLVLEGIKSLIPCIGLFTILRNSSLFTYYLPINSDFYLNSIFLIKLILKLW